MQNIYWFQFPENPGGGIKWAFLRVLNFCHEISWQNMIYHSKVCQSMMAVIFFHFLSFSFKVLNFPYELLGKIFLKYFKKRSCHTPLFMI